MLLEIKDLNVNVEDKAIINGLNLNVQPRELHVIMGPNGAGKSTLAHVLAGQEKYSVSKGSVRLNDEDLLKFSPEERARKGLFMAFQYPVAIPGVSVLNFIKAAVKAVRGNNDVNMVDAINLFLSIKASAKQVLLDPSVLERPLNSDFSGGEKKRIEALQMLMLKPKLAILDEADSGLDVDALKMLGDIISLAAEEFSTGFVIITHYNKLLHHIKPNYVHVMQNGKIIKSGDITLAKYIENNGYERL